MSIKPEVFGKYILLDKLAMGGMAEVYRAKAPGAEGIGKIIALKRILPQFSANAEFIEMFKFEAKIAINLTQGNIGQIYEFGEEAQQFYLAMEFIDGRNLRQILSRCTKLQKAMTIEQCIFILAQIANGLDYAHRCTNKNTGQSLNIIHRDMSPQNIMVSFEGEVKIVDFGIAKAESKIENTRAGTLKGKFGYMSPEQAEGAELDARTDIFSMGIVLWELLSGERLFQANNEVNTIRKIRECQIPSLRKINPNIHEELERISSKALAKDRSLRYQTAADLYRDLSRFLYKVNPEFTQHDLSIFIKGLFKEDILEDRKRVQEYAKIQFPQGNGKDDKTMVVNETTNTITSSANPPDGLHQPTTPPVPQPPAIPDGSAPKNLLPENSVNKSIDFSLKIDRVDLARKVNAGKSPAGLTKNTSTSTKSNINPLTQTNITNSRILRQSSSPSRWIAALFIIGGIGGFAYVLLNNPEKIFRTINHDSTQSAVHADAKKASDKEPAVNQPVAMVESGRVFVRTIPSGAQIEVDGQIVGTTPTDISVPLNKPLNITLRKDGYLSYSKDGYIISKSSDDLVTTLQKANFGYIDIEVIPSTAKITVNGISLEEKSPIKRYPVPAGTQIKVTAVNPFTGGSDETSVIVGQDKVKSVRLYPTKAPRTPTNE